MFDLEALSTAEKTFILTPTLNKFTMTGYFVLESFSPEKIKSLIYEKAIKKFSRLRKKVIHSYGGYYWKEFPAAEALKQIKIFPEINLKTNEDIENYTLKQQSIPYTFNEFPYEFQVMKHGEGGIILVKFDHCVADGIGMIGLLVAMSDNYSLDLYPKLPDISLFYKFLIHLLLPIYIIKYFITNSFLKYSNTPFRLDKDFKRTNKKKIGISKYYSFDLFNNIAKKNGITFNDLFMATVSKVAKDFFKENDPKTNFDNKTFVGAVSVSIRPMPVCLENHRLVNETSGQIRTFKLIDDPLKEGKEIKKVTTTAKNPFDAFAGYYIIDILAKIVPLSIISKMMEQCINYVDIYTSNVPGPKKEIYFNGIKSTDMIVIPTANLASFFLIVNTYGGKFQITLNTDTGVKVCAKKFISKMEAELEIIMNKYNDNDKGKVDNMEKVNDMEEEKNPEELKEKMNNEVKVSEKVSEKGKGKEKDKKKKKH